MPVATHHTSPDGTRKHGQRVLGLCPRTPSFRDRQKSLLLRLIGPSGGLFYVLVVKYRTFAVFGQANSSGVVG
jgi:hypothetical protein